MTVEDMRRRKKELGYTYEQIAELSGVPLGTVQKIFSGVTETPRYDTLQALGQVFREAQADIVREESAVYIAKRQGEYTLEDYYALPDEQRVELIDGVIYDMAAPTSVHQLFVTELLITLREFIKKNQGTCVPISSPVDVQLDCDDKTMVQPDVLVVCDKSKIKNRCVYGAPDLVIEILSKSTRKKDLVIKLNKYMDAGVKEYWAIDTKRKKVIVYDFMKEEYPVIYGFDTVIPVGIFAGKCEISLQEISEYVTSIVEENSD